MARTNNLTNFLTDVADAIKEKKGSETAIPAANFDTEILALPSQGTYEQKVVNVSANGSQTILPSQGYDAIDELTINTAVPEKRLQTKSYSFTQNATLELEPDTGYDGFDSVEVTVNVPGEVINNQDKSVTPTTSSQTISADAGYTGLGTVTVNAVTSAIDADIIAENIKSGVNILGVEGNYSGIDTSDANATALDIYQGKTAYINGQKVTGVVKNYPISNANRFDFGYDYINQAELNPNVLIKNITLEGSAPGYLCLQTPAVGIGNRFAFYNDNRLKTKIRVDVVRAKFGVTADNIKFGATALGQVGTFSQCTDREVSNVKYKSYIGDGTFEKLASGYYKFDSNNMSRSRLEITFTKDTAGDVKLSYKGSGLNTPDPENPESTLSYVYVDLDDSGTPLEPTDASNYTELTFSNVTVGEHTILIEVETGTDTVLEIKLLDEKPITALDIAKGLIGFANGNKIEGTYVPDIEYSTPLAPSSWGLYDVGSFLEHISYTSARVSKINHTIDCTGVTSLSWPSGFTSGLRYIEEFPTLVNTSGITDILSGLWTNFSSLKVIPLFDISGVTNADRIQNLYDVPSTVEEIPAFDLSSISNPSQFVQYNVPFARLNNKTNLSYESINNLLYTVSTINAQSIIPPYRTMSRLGFESLTTDYDESIIETLSNYRAFIEAGWSLS